jgi:peptide/nickel transport system permease protein
MYRGFRRFLSHRGAVAGAAIVALLVALAVLGPILVGDPTARDIDHGLTELGAPLPPSDHAWLGTDQLGRDVWARVVSGARTSLAIALVATLIALVAGLAIGLTAGYAGGRIDDVLMRTVDLALAFPVILFAMMLAALLRQTSLADSSAPVVITLAAVGWTTMARVIRNKAMLLARSEMVTGARAIGASPLRIVLRYVLPNVAGAVAVIAAFGFAQNLIAESVLSFLGLGPPPSEPTWGRMITEGRTYYRSAPHLVLAPGVAIVVAVAGFSLLAGGLRELFDPKERA